MVYYREQSIDILSFDFSCLNIAMQGGKISTKPNIFIRRTMFFMREKKKETSCLPLVASLQSIAAFTKNVSSVTEQSIQYLSKSLSKTSQITI